MTQLRLPLTVSVALLAALALPSRAAAETACASNADCEQGFECIELSGSDCTQPACPPDTTCPEISPCEPVVERVCAPARCTADTDCASGMVCHEWARSGGCAVSDCACSSDQPDCTCPEPVCEEPTVESICTPKYLLPCQAASDCGEGFSCEEQQSCGCSGSPGSGGGAEPAPNGDAKPLPPDEGAAPAPEPDCSCQPSGEFVCVPQQIECDDDAACPAGWSCQQQGGASAPGCAGEGCDALPAPEPQPVTSLCYPEYYSGVGDAEEDGGTPTGGEDKGSGTGNGNPQTPEVAGDDHAAESEESAACQMGHAPATRGMISILALLGALVGLTRRRAQSRV